MLFFLFVVSTTEAADYKKEYEKYLSVYNLGNYKDAFEGFRQLAIDPENHHQTLPDTLDRAISALTSLNRLHEADSFIEKVVSVHGDNWQLLWRAAEAYRKLPHHGFVIGGEFERGYHRGGGRQVNTVERDRVRALQLMNTAWEKIPKNEPTQQQFRFFIEYAHLLTAFRGSLEAWKLGALTDISLLPDYEEWRYSGEVTRGAPASPDGQPIFYSVPESFADAKNDGARYRFLLESARKTYPEGSDEVDFIFAGFLLEQFGVRTLADSYGLFSTEKNDLSDTTKNIFSLHTLRDDETIARLATGISRFTFEDQFNFIKLYQKLSANNGRYATAAVEALAAIYEDRRQLETAARYWQESITRFGKAEHRQQRLDSIVGAWGRFERVNSQVAGTKASVQYRFRNGTSVHLEAQEINIKELISEIQRYLESNPSKLDYEKIDIENIGYRLVTGKNTKFLGKKVASWNEQLKPREKHFDRSITIHPPFESPGAYLLEAKIAGGNTTKIVLWLNDTAIVQKNLDQGAYFFIADAKSGKPLSGATVGFFGYKQESVPNADFITKVVGRTTNVVTKQFQQSTDEEGEIIIRNEIDSGYSWLITASTSKNQFAYLGFQPIWFSRYYDAEYNQTKHYTITDRPVYRPGQGVKFKVWAGQAKYDQEGGSPFANSSLSLEVRNPRNERVFSKNFTADRFGGVNGELELSSDAALGIYSVCLPRGGEYCQSIGNFRVEEYKKPEFEVSVDAPKEGVMLGEKFSTTISAKYYFGEPVRSGKIKYKVIRTNHDVSWYPSGIWDWLYGSGYWWFAYDCIWYPGWQNWGMRAPRPLWWHRPTAPPEIVQENEVPIDEDGKLDITIDTKLAKELHGNFDSRYEITAEVIDESRRTIIGSGEVIVARAPFKVYAWVDRGHYNTGEVISANFSAKTADRQPVQGSGSLRLVKIAYNSKGDPAESVVSQWDLPTDVEGNSQIQIKAAEAGQYRLSYTVVDSKKHEIEGGYLFTVRGENVESGEFRFNEIELIPEKKEYASGEKVKLLINTNAPNSTVVLFLRPTNGVYLPPKVLSLSGKSTVEEIEVSKKDMPNFFVEAFTVSNGQVFTATREIIVPPQKRVLNVEVLPSKDTYKPGEKAEIHLKITDFYGEPFSGSLVTSVYDRAVDYISGGSNVSEIKEFFWKWRRHHSPYQQSNLLRSFFGLTPPGESPMVGIGEFGEVLAEDERQDRDSLMAGVSRSKGALMDAAAPMAASADFLGAESASFQKNKVSEKGNATQRDGSGETAPVTIRKNFADTAYWNGVLVADEKGVAQIDFLMPENLTGWKIRTWALGDGTKVGEGSAEVVTKKDLLLRLQAPRFFVEKDEVVLSANVHNYLKDKKDVTVSLELEGETLEMLGAPSSVVAVLPDGEKRIDWRIKVLKEGEAVIRMKAITDEESDAMEMRFPVYVHGMLKTESFSGALRQEEKEKKFQFTIPESRRSEQTRVEVRYSPTLAGAMVDALPYLLSYPYGCTEQTLSRFLPTVITQKVLQRMGLSLKQIKEKRANLNAQEIGEAPERAAQWKRYLLEPVFDEEEAAKMAQAGVNRLLSMQVEDGGWGWFSGSGEYSSPHTTAHVVHGLQIARGNEVQISQEAISRGITWLENYQAEELQKLKNAKTTTNPWKTYADDLDALTYMVLVDEGKTNNEMRDLLFRDRTKLSVYGNAMLGLALEKQGEKEKVAMIQKNIEQFLVLDKENQTAYLNLPNEGYWWYWYGSEYESHAYYLKLLSRTEPLSEKASGLVKYLLNNRKNATYWSSTRDTATVIEAFADYIKASKEDEPSFTLGIYLDGEKKKEVTITKDNLFSYDEKLILEGDAISSGEHTVEFRKSGKGPLYYNAYVTNFTLEDFITKAGLEVKVNRKYYKLNRVEASALAAGSHGQALQQKVEKYKRQPLDNLSQVTSGDLVEIELEIESKNDYEYLVFEDMKPAGFEPLEVQSGYNGNDLGAYVEFRDNRVAFFVKTLARGKHSVSYRMHAEIPGKFSALPTRGYAMYAPELKANSDEFKVEINDSVQSSGD